MNQYNDATRGIFQNENHAKQLVSFEGMKFAGRSGLYNVTPTDIDGLVQLDKENCFIFFELKHSGGVSNGQGSALMKLCDALNDSGAECTVLIALHNTPYPETIVAKDAVVTYAYYKGHLYPVREHRNLYEIAKNFIDYVKKKQQ